MEVGGINASADSNDNSFINITIINNQTGHESDVHSDNVSFSNRSSISVYSAEEQIIQQRGRRSALKNTLDDLHQIQQRPICKIKTRANNNRDLFRKLRQSSMQSPETIAIKYCQSQNSFDLDKQHDLNDPFPLNSSSSSIETSICKRKSLLRTPVKRRLRFRQTPRRTSLFQR